MEVEVGGCDGPFLGVGFLGVDHFGGGGGVEEVVGGG